MDLSALLQRWLRVVAGVILFGGALIRPRNASSDSEDSIYLRERQRRIGLVRCSHQISGQAQLFQQCVIHQVDVELIGQLTPFEAPNTVTGSLLQASMAASDNTADPGR